MKGQYFYVRDVPFENYWSACEYGKRTNGWIECKVDPWHLEQWASVNPEIFLEYDIWHWIDKGLHDIFSTYSMPRLHWSGGTDSHTLLERAYNLDYKWHSVYTFWMTVYDIGGPAAEVQIPVQWFESCWQQYTLHWDHWKTWEQTNPLLYYCHEWSPGVIKSQSRKHVGFASHNRELHEHYFASKNGFRADVNVGGHMKPTLFRLDDDWYWFQLHSFNDGMSSTTNNHDFYMDGHYPEVAVASVYNMKSWFEQNHPEKQGWCTFGMMDYEEKNQLLPLLGRHKGFTKDIVTGRLGKGAHSQNPKHLHAVIEFLKRGETAPVELWRSRVDEIVEEFRDDHRWIKIFELDDPLREGKKMLFPYMQDHVQFALKITDTGVVPVDHQPIIDEYQHRLNNQL
jgi:hypothetical protein